MTVPSETNRSGPYNGNGVTTVFDYEFKITNESYLRVIKADAAGTETILTLDADYIVSDVGNPAGGQVALTVPLPLNYTLTMLPHVPFTQEIDLENQGAYYAETVENGLDLAVMRDQQLQEQINRAVTIPPSEDPEQLDGLVADILRLADSADEIDTVANNIGAVNTASANMAAIIAAPAQAVAAAASAGAAAGSAVAAAASAVSADVSADEAAASAAGINLPLILPGDAGKQLFVNSDETGYDLDIAFDRGKPIVILATGQSNMTRTPVYDWSPPPNLLLWNFDGVTDTSTVIGTAFVAPSGAKINFCHSFAAGVARDNPTCAVYLINISKDARPIANWLPGAAPIDMYAAIANNVVPALAAAGVDHIDMMLWWQGESDALAGLSSTYIGNFQTVQTRFRGEDWFPYETPILLVGTSLLADSSVKLFNKYLTSLVSRDPSTKKYFFTGALPVGYWDAPTSYLHMTGEGYAVAGHMAWEQCKLGHGTPSILGLNVDPVSGNFYIGTPGVPDDSNNVLGIRRDVAALVNIILANLSAGAGASADLSLASAGGTLTLSSRQDAIGDLQWTGSGNLRVRAPSVTVDNSLKVLGNGGIGYGAGAGGAVAQATNKATGVTLNKASGQITMNAAALAAGTIVSFMLTDSAIAAGDILILNHTSGGTPGAYSINARCAAGSATIDVRNNTAGSLSEAIVIVFAVVKAVTT
ncbi:hypothetical protein EOB59_31735 [Mesorhizobium sp. M7A.F.Ca.MR.176.00.0.0]|uniref:sialate O-acetylesterase n=1 Tax=Mesorhizobium sp. M7A.F.Ca.MR.176.00.0.0 TaxID=2496776 RepID=UPI000FD4EB9F|nr:sialate O-acetylesterase [Mesorhizobium sp. M7A.F.Ca.MR.176.00.0.0]RUU85559.1 hypothetical protein EOB59_31735 [Mesorhizobium sp. M7A.F.Ca.MR.176.00.0.0]